MAWSRFWARAAPRSEPAFELLEDRCLFAAQPVVTVDGSGDVLIGESAQFTVTFVNLPDASPGSDVANHFRAQARKQRPLGDFGIANYNVTPSGTGTKIVPGRQPDGVIRYLAVASNVAVFGATGSESSDLSIVQGLE